MTPPDPCAALREALALSPDNGPLRRLLADTLLSQGRVAEAEEEYRRVLAILPDDAAVQLGLLRAFVAGEKVSAGLALV